MGSLISKPKAPPAPAPVIISNPLPAPASTVEPDNENRTENMGSETESAADKSAVDADSGDNNAARQNRASDLLRRNRGKGGTILTSFRGVLNDRLKNEPRKTLLGE